MSHSDVRTVEKQLVSVPTGEVTLRGNLSLPQDAGAVVVFAHGSGSSRHSPRNRHVARLLNEAGLATLLIDLLTADEDLIDMRTARLRFDIELLSERLVSARPTGSCNLPILRTFGSAISARAPAPPQRWWRQFCVAMRSARLSPEVAGPIWPVSR
jgi:hypothetical protein